VSIVIAHRFAWVLGLLIVATPSMALGGGVSELPFVVVPQPIAGRLNQGQDRIIRDQAEWEQFWASQFPEHPAPAVDFEHKLVVLTALGFTVSSGASIHVTRVTLRHIGTLLNPLVTVHILETRQRASCIGTGDGSAPFEAIVLDSYLDVTFRRTSKYLGCR
jgi:hypothetical protein